MSTAVQAQLVPAPIVPTTADIAPRVGRVIAVMGAVPRTGASSVTASIACAASGVLERVRLVDAASTRRSGLREMAPNLGPAQYIDAGVLISSRCAAFTIQHIDTGDMDSTVQDPESWTPIESDARWDATVIDLGRSAEEIVTAGIDGRSWLQYPGLDPWIVLVLPTDRAGLLRTEAAMGEWGAMQLPRLGAAITCGPNKPVPTGPLTQAVLARAQHMPWLPALSQYGLAGPDLPAASIAAGQSLLAALGGPFATTPAGKHHKTPLVTAPRRRLFNRRNPA